MARETLEFDLHFVNYRTLHFSAVEGFAMVEHRASIHPVQLLRLTEVQTADGAWASLDRPRAIDEHVRDRLHAVSPHVALGAVMDRVTNYNFGFLEEWKPVEVPERFTVDTRKQPNAKPIDPFLSRLINERLATIKELEEYYCLRDAFKIFDMSCDDAVKKALAQEAAEIAAKKKARSG